MTHIPPPPHICSPNSHTSLSDNHTIHSMNPFFSIIIPVYNVQEYIARCLNSCINQTFKEIEIIIIDDCGSDDSMEIAREFAKQDKRIRILTNAENLGLFHTRIVGEREARGEYIMPLDSDDYIDLDACERIYNLLTQDYNERGEWVDLCCFAYFDTNKEDLNYQKIHFNGKNLWEEMIKFSGWSIWNKAYKKSLLDKTNAFIQEECQIPKLSAAEDALKLFIISLFAQNAIGMHDKYHHYCDNPQSITRTDDKEKLQKNYFDHLAIIKTLDSIPAYLLNSKNNGVKDRDSLQKYLRKEGEVFRSQIDRKNRKTNFFVYVFRLIRILGPYKFCVRAFLYIYKRLLS
ncbi:glycosyltransferase family 2 protein [Helicobacter enhydrae]|nr:glycosyltransferase family 2 protein [Helicobacter enhydrae]